MKIIDVKRSQATQDGAGVKISRIADFSGTQLDPFLMVDELKSDDKADFIGGFPPHPHRGMETFTYMIKGGFEHRDQMGNKRVISDGHVQWMSTGFGVVHSEMPVAAEDGMHGFQIWINMPAKHKLRPPIYQDSVEQGLPEINNASGGTLRALGRQWNMSEQSVTSPINNLSANAAIADLRLVADSKAELDLSAYEQAFIYIHTGEMNDHTARSMLVLDPQEPVLFSSEQGGGALIFAANKLREPVAHMGPFVMNTQAELVQAVQDYQAGKFGTLTST
jgi:redox-sensitive bicupin YhaK (pirin superfamily)